MNRLALPYRRFGFTLVLLSLLNLVSVEPALTKEKLMRTLTVTGEGMEKISTTLTQVELGVEIKGKTAIEVQQELAKRTSAVVDLLESSKVEQLQTTGIQLQPNYDYSNNRQNLIGYIGTNTVSFRLETERAGNLLDEAVEAGATRIDRVSFTATDTAISEAQKEALRQATIDARSQAEAVLETLNFSPEEIVSIQINGANVPEPKLIQAERLMSADAAEPSTPVIGGEQTVRASVTLQISY
ncbi:SIMPL domain-containing protein [Myxosarcina sp. GI1]|uniref:SIMPL domain-containing protein n=1 Tax=Myxosarcina sp. GI1 TaxID=1541065 RepID=UPI00056640A1|nr:SIMPL domain-containing protein [Myxosarcina sp. GI1]